MITQYAQQTTSQSSIPNQSQSQPIYGTNQANAYTTNPNQANQYPGNSNLVQYAGGNNVNSIYGMNGQSSAYSQSVLVSQASQNSQYQSNSSQYGGSQYGSSGSINQYAQAQIQYGVPGQPQQGQYGNNVQNSVNNSVNPYGSPSNTVNQYGTVGTAANANAYNPISSSGPPPPPMGPPGGPAAPPPPPPPPAPNANSNAIPNAPSMGPGMLGAADIQPDTNSLAAALQAARLKKKQVNHLFSAKICILTTRGFEFKVESDIFRCIVRHMFFFYSRIFLCLLR